MDAKVDDWVVTPRRGKAVEINALWYNALRLMEQWAGEHERRRRRRLPRPRRARASARSTSASGIARRRLPVRRRRRATSGGNDPKCRPNQVFAISLPHPVLARERWAPVMRVVRDRLLTPVGLRSLAPGDPRLQGALLRRSARARRRVPPGHGLGVAGRSVRRCVAEGLSGRRRRRAAGARRVRRRISTRRASDRSARSSTPSRRSRRAAASRRRGASPKCCACRHG